MEKDDKKEKEKKKKVKGGGGPVLVPFEEFEEAVVYGDRPLPEAIDELIERHQKGD